MEAKAVRFKLLDRWKEELVRDGLVSRENLKLAELKAERENTPLGDALVRLRILTEEQLARFIGNKMHIPYVNMNDYTIDRQVLELVPEKLARQCGIMPLFRIENSLTIAIVDPTDIVTLDDISRVTGCKVEPVIASEQSIDQAADQWYGLGEAREDLVRQLAEELKETRTREERDIRGEIAEIRLTQEATEPPIVRLVNTYIAQALLEGASDIHLEPKRKAMEVRFRIDGFLYNRHQVPTDIIAPVTSRIKIMSALDISKRRVPQDGRIGVIIRNKAIDIRVSTFPSLYGENVVLRILDKSKGIPSLSELGFSEEDLGTFKNVIKATKGIILATGPTGSGKTTTTYAAIAAFGTTDKNIMTIEDPIEYELPGIVQSQIDLKTGLTFANALRSILRQDPDIIYVGEIRDSETAEIAVRSALTGHLVLSTLHTNHAVGAITRLRDIGVEAGLLEAVLNCCYAERLVRKICPRCIQSYAPEDGLLGNLNLPPDARLYRGQGCEFCSGIGYRGRIGIFEILVVTKEIRKRVAENASEQEILAAARAQGMKSIFEDGLRKVLAGITTLEEVKRVTEET